MGSTVAYLSDRGETPGPGEPQSPLAFAAKLHSGATIMADNDEIHQIPIKNLISEDGAHELASSPDMKLYLEFIKAVVHLACGFRSEMGPCGGLRES
jgi:hypothetical protein